MNLHEYARHRKARGLRGTSHVAVLKAIQAGRLSERSARKVGTRWEIKPEVADAEWGRNTDPGPQEESRLEPASRGVPNRLHSKAIREGYMAKLAALQWEKETKARVLRSEVEKEAFELGRQVREAILNVPDRLSHDLAAITEPAMIHIRLTEALIEALGQLTQ